MDLPPPVRGSAGRPLYRPRRESFHFLARQPGVGHLGRYRHPRLAGLRVWAVAKPFGDWLIFYWERPEYVDLFRLMHGARDLPRRLVEGQPSD